MHRRVFTVLTLVLASASLPLASAAQTPAPSASPSASPSPSAPVSRSISIPTKARPGGRAAPHAVANRRRAFVDDLRAALALRVDRYDAFEKDAIPAAGSIVSDKRESCGSGNVHRVNVQLGGQIAEVAVAFLHGTAYKYVYTRPAAHEADPAAERTLTAFCRGTGPIVPGLTPV